MERITSPEQLNEYVKISNPGIWYVVSGLLVLLIAVGIWAVTGTIPETVKLTGVAFSAKTVPDQVFCYVTMGMSKRLQNGMKVQVSPDYAPREEYGYIYGRIDRVGEKPVTRSEIVETFGGVQYVQEMMPRGNAVEVRITLQSNAAGLIWSNRKGRSVSVTSGSSCYLLIVTRERRPYEIVF